VASTPLTGTDKRLGKKKSGNVAATSTPLRQVSTPVAGNEATYVTYPKGIKTEDSNSVVPIVDKPGQLLSPLPSSFELPPHLGDRDPLLMSHIPPVPSQEELEALIGAPPLTYTEARGELTAEDLGRPTRGFCEICGYWGRVKCTKCGSRVCALECLRTHQEDCYTRYGA
jgi:zinc finger HIT domain-containing protein 1